MQKQRLVEASGVGRTAAIVPGRSPRRGGYPLCALEVGDVIAVPTPDLTISPGRLAADVRKPQSKRSGYQPVTARLRLRSAFRSDRHPVHARQAAQPDPSPAPIRRRPAKSRHLWRWCDARCPEALWLSQSLRHRLLQTRRRSACRELRRLRRPVFGWNSD